ncbi:MAG: C4-dicarboxylate ABC transporter permease [Alphaproteobacteria bacterium TMED87]|nr:C4-dicarboxylate ABC transporter permease [Rhodospirillaceae bacterium]OUV10158.1 MAG: C4-dicarboxylate ABC transporter permease [Alphaproteobacteria bacterium TMED87]
MSGIILAIILITLLILRMNIIVLLGVATFWSYYFYGGGELMNVVYDMWDASNREVLLSIPLYILAGTIMSKGSIAARLIKLMRAITAPVPGGLAIAGLLSCGVFAAISGSSAVTLLAVGSIMYPALIEEGYSRPFSIGMLCAGGTLGIIIPPSIPLILYGVMTQESIADLFLAGTGPAILLLFALSCYAMVVNRSRRGKFWNLSDIILSLKQAIFALLTPFVILGGIYSGYFTPTESAAVAVLTALAVEIFAHKRGLILLVSGKINQLKQTLKESTLLVWNVVGETSSLMGSLFPILTIALSLNVFMTYEQIPALIVEAMTSFIDSKLLFLFMTNIFLLAVGLFLDIGSAILILSPLLPPMASDYGMNMIHFGIMMIVNLEIGYLTPPMGLNIIIAMGAFREDFLTIVKGVLPFILIMIACLIVVMFVPKLSLFLIQ